MVDVAKIACREYILSPSSRKAFRTRSPRKKHGGLKPITVAPNGNLIQRFELNVSERFNRGGGRGGESIGGIDREGIEHGRVLLLLLIDSFSLLCPG